MRVCFLTFVSLLAYATPAISQQAADTGSQTIAEAIKADGFIPMSLMEDSFTMCRDAAAGEDTPVRIEHCGIILVTAIQNAMRFKVGDVALDTVVAEATVEIERTNDSLARTFAKNISLSNSLIEEQNLNASLEERLNELTNTLERRGIGLSDDQRVLALEKEVDRLERQLRTMDVLLKSAKRLSSENKDQTIELQRQLSSTQALLSQSEERLADRERLLKSLGLDLNINLARLASRERKIRELKARLKEAGLSVD